MVLNLKFWKINVSVCKNLIEKIVNLGQLSVVFAFENVHRQQTL